MKYVETLVAPDTVNTLPPETLDAYRDHGEPAVRIEDDLEAARALPGRLAALGIELAAVAEELERDGVRKFIEPYDALMLALGRRRTELAVS